MSEVRRWSMALTLAALVTLAILVLMQALVVGRRELGRGERAPRVLEFVRLMRDSTVDRRERRRPEPIDLTRPPALPRLVPEPVTAPRHSVARVPVPAFDAASIVTALPGLGAAPADSAAVPLVTIDPEYPPRALARGVEGWVHLRFTVTADGTTAEVEVVDADPRGYFERAARRAVRRYRYQPRVENGVAVSSPGEELVISFELDQ